MFNIPSSPPIIKPLPPGEDRPLWSVMVPVYNCSQYLTDTLESILAQQIPQQEMQIEVVDDASTDADVEELVRRIGKGRIGYYRQEQNVGSLGNFETCINRARGHLVHLLHGDDKVEVGYYQKMAQLFREHPEAGAAYCRYQYINEAGRRIFDQRPEMQQDGILENWLLRIGEFQRIQYAAISVRREVYERLGGFYGVTYGEDWEMWVRIARHYPVAYTPEVLACYRKHDSSISGQKIVTGDHLRDLEKVMNYIQAYLPEEHREAVLQKSRKVYAKYGLKIANQLWHNSHSRSTVQAQIRQSLTLDSNLLLYYKIMKLYIKMLVNWR